MKSRIKVWHLALLVIITAVCYINSLHSQFVFDDQVIVFQPEVMNVHSWSDVAAIKVGWRRLLYLTYAVNYYWTGLDPVSYHVVNLALHIVNVALIYLIIAAVAPIEAALAGAMIFGVHTLFSGAVSYIAGRSSILCATFYFSALLLFLKGLAADRRKQVVYFGATAVLWFVAWVTKQEAITLPPLLAAVLFLKSEKKDWRWIAPLIAIPLIAAFLIRDQIANLYSLVSTNQVLRSAGFGEVLRMPVYFYTYCSSVIWYCLPRFLVPVNLNADPEIAPVEHWYSPEFILAVVVLLGLASLALRLQKREPLFSMGIAALFVSPLMAYALIPLPDVVQEHRAYIPGLGVAFLGAWLFEWLRKHYAQYRWIALGAVTVLLVFMTVNRNRVWADNISFWQDASAKSPGKARPVFNLGQAYQNAGRWPDALREYDRAIALKPDIYAAYSNRAAILLDAGQLEEARRVLEQVTSLSPSFTEGFINLGVLYLRLQEPDNALKALNNAIKIDPANFGGHFNKGEALTAKGDFKNALESYKEAVRLRPDMPAFRMSLGSAYLRAGDPASAEKQFVELTEGPLAADAYRNLGMLYYQSGNPDRATEYLQRALNLRNVYPDAHHDLGVVYLQRNMRDEAMREFQTTLSQQPDHGPATLNLALVYQLKGDVASARNTLAGYIQRYGNSNSPYITQAKLRLDALK